MQSQQHRPGPLAGVIVIDLTRVLSGPYCTMLLADQGARVIKVEVPGEGDDARHMPPFVDGKSVYFDTFNRGKESLALDLKNAEDREILDGLLDTADILVDNFRPGIMARLGYAPERVAARWPHLVQASISGFGQTGPYAGRPAYDLVIQAMGGVMALTGEEGGAPARVGTSLIDIGTGLFAAVGILSALNERRVTGRGRYVDVGMFDCQVAMLEHALLRQQLGDPPQRLGARFPTAAPAEAFRTADGWLVIAAVNDRQFATAMRVIGRAELADDPRFAVRRTRLENHVVLKAEIEAALSGQATAHWDSALSRAGVPCGPVNTVADLLDDPQLAARHMIVAANGLRVAGNPIKMSGAAEWDETPAAPVLDEARARLVTKPVD